jgi:ABC-type nitrate/sulfonate/bicarbonate transport system permease component
MSKSKRTLLIQISAWTLGFVFLIFVWWLVSYLMHLDDNRLLPYPSEAFLTLNQLLWAEEAGTTWQAIGWTLARLVIGFLVSFLLGGLLGTLAGNHPAFKSFFKPFIVFAKSMPTAAFVIILIGIFYKFRGLPPYIPCFLVFLVAFPVIYEAFCSGVENESQDTKDALDLDVGRKSVVATVRVIWPDSESYILLAVAQSLGLSMKVSVMSEILTNSSSSQGGIGGLIQESQMYASMKEIIAYSIIAVLMVLIIDIPLYLVKKNVKKHLD